MKIEIVIGKVFKFGEYDCIFVICFGMGFGIGGGEGEVFKFGYGEGGGVGVGMGIEFIGFLVVRGVEIFFVSIKINCGLLVVFEKVFDLLIRFMEM